MSKSSDDYMDDILNELNEGLPQPEASDVSSSKDSNDSKGDKEKSDANSESGADDWFADVSFDDDEPYPNDTGSDSKDDAPTGGSVPSMPNDEFSVSLDDDSISSDGFDDSVLDADPSVSPSVEEPESVITQDDIDDGFSDSLLLDEEQVENESLEEVADTSTTVDNGNPASESVMPPDEEKDVDDIFGESMFNDDDEDALNDDAPHENVAVDNSANLTASDETPDHEDDFGGMVDLSDEDGLYGNMIGDEDGEDHNGAVEDLSMVDIIDDEDDEEQANLTRDENAVSAFSQGVDSADVDSVADEDLDSLQQMESTLESLDSIADNDFIQPVEAEDVAPPKPDMATTALGEKDAEENNVVDNSDGKPAKNDAKENKPTVKSDAASGGPSSIRIISSAVAISVMLSLGTVAGGVYSGLLSFTGGAPGKQSVIDSSARDSISAIRAELDEIKASNSDVMRRQEVALAEFKSTVGKLEEEQRNVSRLTKQIKEGAASYEKLMIARLEKQLELMLSLSEKQSSQSQSITDQVMREVESYLKKAEQASERNIKP